MAEETNDGQEKTENPTDDRREQFRTRGDIAHSREITSVFVLIASLSWINFSFQKNSEILISFLRDSFESISFYKPSSSDILDYFYDIWFFLIKIIIPISAVSMTVSILVTFIQTKMNISSKRLAPQWSRISLISGLKRIASLNSIIELIKSIGKIIAVSVVMILILFSEWGKVPALMSINMVSSWYFWGEITWMLFGSVLILLFIIASIDYLYNYISLENKMKMTKNEVKEEFKQREIDPQIKMRLRRLQRDLIQRRSIDATKKATVLVTNPTHYSIALFYETGMSAPILLAKGKGFIALKMREIAKTSGIPIVEDKPVARYLYHNTENGEEIPQNLYKAVSEIIRYVFKIKGMKINSLRNKKI